MAVVTLSNK